MKVEVEVEVVGMNDEGGSGGGSGMVKTAGWWVNNPYTREQDDRPAAKNEEQNTEDADQHLDTRTIDPSGPSMNLSVPPLLRITGDVPALEADHDWCDSIGNPLGHGLADICVPTTWILKCACQGRCASEASMPSLSSIPPMKASKMKAKLYQAGGSIGWGGIGERTLSDKVWSKSDI
ncbi:hypothetical protein HD554DRAFT_2038069 [Boletus coccyginus]|nr:hypothetical protein HD554DRAFT_2038069 [Boletus coccyginus]